MNRQNFLADFQGLSGTADIDLPGMLWQ